MRFSLNRLPSEEPCRPDELGWVPIGGSDGRRGYLWAIGAGLLALSCLLIMIILFSLRLGGSGSTEPRAGDAVPWLAVLAAPLLSILAHESLHLLWHPGNGRSDRSVVLFWPRRLRFGVYYAGCLSRRRWLQMRLAPLVILAILPAVLLAVGEVSLTYFQETFLVLLIVVNSVGSGGDLAAVWLVWRRVPAGSHLCFCNGRAYWRGEY